MILQYSKIPQYYWLLKKNSSSWHTNSKKIRTLFHGTRALSQSLLKIMYSTSVKNRRNNYSSGDVDEAITKIQTVKSVHKYGISRQTIVWKYVEEKRPGYLTVMGDTEEMDLVQWVLAMQKQGLQVGREMITQKASEIHRYTFGSTRSLVSVGRGWCEQFISRHG